VPLFENRIVGLGFGHGIGAASIVNKVVRRQQSIPAKWDKNCPSWEKGEAIRVPPGGRFIKGGNDCEE